MQRVLATVACGVLTLALETGTAHGEENHRRWAAPSNAVGDNPNPVLGLPRERSGQRPLPGPTHNEPAGYVYDPMWPYPEPCPHHFPHAHAPGPCLYLPLYYYPWGLPPLYLPGELIYGPEAAKRMMGADAIQPVPPTNMIIVPNEQERRDENQPHRATNAKSVALGRHFIGQGDGQFRGQDYAGAYRSYKKAAQAAPALADPFFRQGFALMALGSYGLAAKAVRKGLASDPNWAASGFRSDGLYGANRAAKTAHIDGLAQAALDQPDNADLLFLLGVELYFDGQTERAFPFLERAARLSADLGALAAGFLKRAKPVEL